MRVATVLASTIQNVFRMGSALVGALLVAVLPVAFWADVRQEANAAAGLLPNMDPGAVVSIAIVFVVFLLCVVCLVEAVRNWVFKKKPLTYLSCFLLGSVATWPVGISLVVKGLNIGQRGIAISAMGSVAVFYLARWIWNAKHQPESRAI